MKSPSSFVGFPEAPKSNWASVQVVKKAKNGQKWKIYFKIQSFWFIWLEKPKDLSSLLSYNLWNGTMLKNEQWTLLGASKDLKMAKKGWKMTHFGLCQKIMKKMKFFHQNIYICKNIVSVKYWILETAEKFVPQCPIRPKTGIKWS